VKKALSYSVACRFEGMLRRVLHALAEEALQQISIGASKESLDRRAYIGGSRSSDAFSRHAKSCEASLIILELSVY
jgi:hypothetical protein